MRCKGLRCVGSCLSQLVVSLLLVAAVACLGYGRYLTSGAGVGAVPVQRVPVQRRSVPLDGRPSKTEYWSPIAVGSPAQRFTVQFDTGSSDVWLPGNASAAGAGQRHFEASASASFRPLGERVEIRYGTGHMVGWAGEDEVEVGGVRVRQGLTLAESLDASLQSDPYDGIVGLAFPSLLSGPGRTWLQTLQASQLLPNGVTFAFEIAADGTEGHLVFGVQPSGPVKWVDVLQQPLRAAAAPAYSFWQAKVDLRVGSRTFPSTTAMVDSGTSCLVLPGDLYHPFNGTSELLPCDTELPTVAVLVDGEAFEMTSQDFMIPADDADEALCQVCVQQGAPDDQLILGDVFHRKVQVTYDYEHARLGFPVGEAAFKQPAPPRARRDVALKRERELVV